MLGPLAGICGFGTDSLSNQVPSFEIRLMVEQRSCEPGQLASPPERRLKPNALFLV